MQKTLHDLRNNAISLKILIRNLNEKFPDLDEVKLARIAIERLMENLKEIENHQIDTSN